MQAVVNGLMTNYQRSGKGPAILLLHGWGDSSKTFLSLTKHLTDKYEVLSLDLPGFGATQVPTEAWGLNEYAHFVQAWLLKIKAPSLYAVVGHSNGGAIAMVGLTNGNFAADKLVLLAASGIRGGYSPKRQVRKAIVKSGKFIVAPMPAPIKFKLKRRIYNATGSEALLYPELEDSFRKIISQDIRASASNLKLPTLIIYGTADKATPPAFGRIYAGLIKKSRLEVIEGAGHFVQHEATDQVENLIRGFLED